MEITTRSEKNTVVVTVNGRLDALTSPEFEKSLSEFVTKGELSILLDLLELDYISSAGLRSILATAKKLKAKNGELCIAGLQGSVRDVFQMSGFYSIFRVFESAEEALKRE
jgi:anti-anti-sigma factor